MRSDLYLFYKKKKVKKGVPLMAESLEKKNIVEETIEDKLKIADEVIETIAGLEASNVPHVVSMSGGSFTEGLSGILGKKSPSKGVKVETIDDKIKIYISIVVEYGCKIHMVAKEVQNAVRKSIENMTGMEVAEVNVSVVGISIPKEAKKDEAAPEAIEEKK